MSLKKKIITESLKLFSLKGFLRTSISDILAATNSSKGGFYNHFRSKDDLYFAVLKKAKNVWRERNLDGLTEIENPIDKIKKLLANYKDKYLKDSINFPGGCIFVTLSVELDDQRPDLASELKKGFDGLKSLINRLLDEGKKSGQVRRELNTMAITEMIFAGMVGASVIYGIEKSAIALDQRIDYLFEVLDGLSPES
ncbi:MAG: TetR/AcrR family transcriptional regulator [Deltaproteobacteria bacterium]|nr:TetR/AcrR family transcriptional regulator [Deltaproteobacteria bacterium]